MDVRGNAGKGWELLKRWFRHEEEVKFMVVLLLLVGGVLGFGTVADAVTEGETQMLDRTILLALREPGQLGQLIGPPWLSEVFLDLTALGGYTILLLVSMLALVFLLLLRRWDSAAFLGVACLGGVGLNVALKAVFMRTRPDVVPHLSEVVTASFPSGHALTSTAIYLTLGMLLAHGFERRRFKLFFMGTAVTVSVLIGLSRLVLGVHFPSDVLAGWMVGGSWAMLCWLVLKLMERRGWVESYARSAGEEEEIFRVEEDEDDEGDDDRGDEPTRPLYDLSAQTG